MPAQSVPFILPSGRTFEASMHPSPYRPGGWRMIFTEDGQTVYDTEWCTSHDECLHRAGKWLSEQLADDLLAKHPPVAEAVCADYQ